jgi:transposase InsO family protein
MPWKESSAMSNRREFVLLALQPHSNVRELCRRFGVSPKTGYKWISRYQRQGETGLAEQSRRPHHSPARSATSLEQEVLALHRAYPPWGARKLRSLLAGNERPHHSTIEAILRRHGCSVQYGQASEKAPANGRFEHASPNELWQMDFKGHFPLLHARLGRCHPLTLLDDHSRYALCLKACADEQAATVQAHLAGVFRRYGLPRRITADNGPPWGTHGQGGLSALEVWLMRLGIRVSHSRPYHRQTQGKLERFHQTLKRELLARTGYASLEQCQREMDRWRHCYNEVRPHQGLDQQTPLSRYRVSARAYPEQLPPLEYDDGERVLKVRKKGQIVLRGRTIFVGEGLASQHVAIRPTESDGVFNIVFIDKTIRKVDFNIKDNFD